MSQPFLTVMVRTTGTRATLVDTLTCLAAQTCDDFEVYLLIDTADDTSAATALAHLEPFDHSFRDRVHVSRFGGGNRVTGLNHAVTHGRGRWFIMLDDDDLVTADWVEQFLDAANQHPDAVLRTRAVEQHVVRHRAPDSIADFEPTSGFELSYAETFDFIEHLHTSVTPSHTFAIPAMVFHHDGVRFDPELPVYEDLDVLLQAAAHHPVVDLGTVTAIYRRWHDDEATVHAVAWNEWERSKERILQRLDAAPLTLPAGSATRLMHLAYENKVLREQAATASAAQSELDAVYRSRSWRLTAPLRILLQRLRSR